jgi:putative chitinase
MNYSKLQPVLPAPILDELPEVCEKYLIDTPVRLSHFLSQCDHESAGFKIFTENLNYSAEGLRKTFPKYFPGVLADSYARKPVEIGSRVYADRLGNGNQASHEGFTYRGRGCIQVTGKNNYAEFDKEVPENILANPDLVASKYPLMSAGWFWHTNNVNTLADLGITPQAIEAVRRKVNGGIIGLEDVKVKFNKYFTLLKSE